MRALILISIFSATVLMGSLAAGQGTPTSAPSSTEARGQRLFAQCQACHAIAAGAPHKLGPNLYGIVGTRAASQSGYAYSTALQKSGIIWDEKNLDRWLERTNVAVPGTKMIFAGMTNQADRAAIIAYLKRSSPKPR